MQVPHGHTSSQELATPLIASPAYARSTRSTQTPIHPARKQQGSTMKNERMLKSRASQITNRSQSEVPCLRCRTLGATGHPMTQATRVEDLIPVPRAHALACTNYSVGPQRHSGHPYPPRPAPAASHVHRTHTCAPGLGRSPGAFFLYDRPHCVSAASELQTACHLAASQSSVGFMAQSHHSQSQIAGPYVHGHGPFPAHLHADRQHPSTWTQSQSASGAHTAHSHTVTL